MDASGSYRKIRTGTKQYYVCSKCNFSSESEYNVSSHFRLSHVELIKQSKNTLYSCSECSYEIADKRQLLDHMHSSHLIRRK